MILLSCLALYLSRTLAPYHTVVQKTPPYFLITQVKNELIKFDTGDYAFVHPA